MVMRRRSRMLPATTSIRWLKGKGSRIGSRCLLCQHLTARRMAAVEGASTNLNTLNETLGTRQASGHGSRAFGKTPQVVEKAEQSRGSAGRRVKKVAPGVSPG